MAPMVSEAAGTIGEGLDPQELLRRALDAFREQKVMVAGRYLQELESRGRALEALEAAASPDARRRLGDLRRVHGRVTRLRASLVGDDGWEVQRDADGIRVLYQSLPSGFIRTRLDAEIDAPLFDLLVLLREVQLFTTWIPHVGGLGLCRAEELGATSILNFCFRTEVALPWPMRNRRCTFALDGVDCMNPEDAPQQVAVLFDSGAAQANCPTVIDYSAGRNGPVDMDMIDSGVIITPAEVAGTKRTLFQGIFCVDPKMAVPRWMVNLGVRHMCYLIGMQLRRAVAVTRLPPHLAASTDPNNPFYAYVRRRLGESLPSQLALAPPLATSPADCGKPAAKGEGKAACAWFCAAVWGPCMWRTGDELEPAICASAPGAAGVAGPIGGPASVIAAASVASAAAAIHRRAALHLSGVMLVLLLALAVFAPLPDGTVWGAAAAAAFGG